ncbi:hypothetical protein PHYPSEUDO_002284 [Phytophthora pseudosyringae]|uniref:Transmembrane protein n=1 Tax=Phytophthora pseudosyringae TaxID=221518 RepID=A0A8T1V1T0_9STRA|nr:hypothetical protein PHYPSEUDO_002284 [Phytophthora pseudosyringae]
MKLDPEAARRADDSSAKRRRKVELAVRSFKSLAAYGCTLLAACWLVYLLPARRCSTPLAGGAAHVKRIQPARRPGHEQTMSPIEKEREKEDELARKLLSFRALPGSNK